MGTKVAQVSIARGEVSVLPDRLARILRLLRDSKSALQPRRVDSSEITHVPLAAVAERAKPLSRSCADVAYPSSSQRLPPAHRPDSGACPVIRRSNSTAKSLFRFDRSTPTQLFLPKLNSIEPPWYVTRMPGGVTGTAREGLPMSINHPFWHSAVQVGDMPPAGGLVFPGSRRAAVPGTRRELTDLCDVQRFVSS